MKKLTLKVLISAFLLFQGGIVTAEEQYVGKLIESRLAIAIAAGEAGAQALIPEGYKLLTLPKGPLAGANTILILMDKQYENNDAGDPIRSQSARAVAVANYGIQPGQPPKLFVTKVYETEPMGDSYGNSQLAEIERTVTIKQRSGLNARSESWSVIPSEDGSSSLDIAVSYEEGRSGWSSGEFIANSNVNEGFSRIYRYDRIEELLSSKAMGKPLNGDVSVNSTLADLCVFCRT